MVESAQYTRFGSPIFAVINGQEMFVPDDMSNSDRQAIAEWEAKGNTIAPYVPPAPAEE